MIFDYTRVLYTVKDKQTFEFPLAAAARQTLPGKRGFSQIVP
jgi:hypothetical protein